MTSGAQPFRVERVELDLPALAGAFCRRLHDAGLRVTPARAADLTRAVALVRPVSRRRLYFTARPLSSIAYHFPPNFASPIRRVSLGDSSTAAVESPFPGQPKQRGRGLAPCCGR